MPHILKLGADLCSVAVISVAVVADSYSVESSAYMVTMALLKASGMSLIKIEKSNLPGLLERLIKEHPLFNRQYNKLTTPLVSRARALQK